MVWDTCLRAAISLRVQYHVEVVEGDSGSGLLTYNSHMARLWNTERVTTYIKKPKAYNKVLKY